MRIGGVCFPMPPCWQTVRTYQQKICDEFGLKMLDGDKKGAVISPEVRMSCDITAAIATDNLIWKGEGKEKKLVGLNDTQPIFCSSFDSAMGYKGQKVTAVCEKLVNQIKAGVNAPHHTSTWMLYEGGDNWADLVTMLGESRALLNQLIKYNRSTFKLKDKESGPGLNVNPHCPAGPPEPGAGADLEANKVFDTPCSHFGCSDGAAARAQFGQAGCSHKCPCWYCDALDVEMCDVDERTSKRWTARTLKQNAILSHTAIGFCTGCQCEIVSSPAMIRQEKKQARLAKRKPRPMMVMVKPFTPTGKLNELPKEPSVPATAIGHTRPGYCAGH